MFGIGSTELIVILVVGLIVLGPKKLPEIARTLGKAMGEFRRVSTDFQRSINTEIARDDLEREKTKAKKDLFGDDKKKEEEKPQEQNESDKAWESAVAANTDTSADADKTEPSATEAEPAAESDQAADAQSGKDTQA
jgi:sec-independent protein translocase protein TatB